MELKRKRGRRHEAIRLQEEIVEAISSPIEGHIILLGAVMKQAIEDASGLARSSTTRKPGDLQLAWQAAPWLAEVFPNWQEHLPPGTELKLLPALPTQEWTAAQRRAIIWHATPSEQRQPPTANELAAELGVNPKTVYSWRKKCPGFDQAVEEERARLMKPKSIEERITAIEAQRADLAAQLKQARTKAEQAASTGGNILAAQTTVRDLEGALGALDQALAQAQEEHAAEQAQAHRAQLVEQLRELVEQRQAALQQMGEHAQAIHAALEVHLTGLRAAHATYRQMYYDAALRLRDLGAHLKHFMQMTEDQEVHDAALLDDLAAQGLDLDLLLAVPDTVTNWHHHATRPDALGPLLPEDAPFRAEVTRLVFAQHTPPAPPPHQTTDARRSPLAPASQPGAAPDDGRAAFIQQVKDRVRQAESGDTAA
jgi:hypothetical protein